MPPEKTKLMRDSYGLDSAMIGRASIEIPGFLTKLKNILKQRHAKTINFRKNKVARRHLEMSIKWKGERLGILETEDTTLITLRGCKILNNIEQN